MDCWSCGAERGDASFCNSCELIQPDTQRRDFFEVLGIPRRMTVDRSALSKAFREGSAKVHPDRFGNKSAVERRLAVQQTATLNDAYRTLKDPQKRAEYLMSLEGVDVGGEEKRTNDPAFLMAMMELQEEADGAKTLDAIDAMLARVQQTYDERMGAIVAYFDEKKGAKDDIVRALDELRYYRRLKERLKARREETV